MFCRNCGNQLADDAKFCNKCGTAAVPAEPVVAPPVAPAEPEIPTAPTEPEIPIVFEEPAVPYMPEKPAKKGLPLWAVILIVLGGLIVALGAFVLVDGLANEGKITESIIGVNFFAEADDDDDDKDKDKDKEDEEPSSEPSNADTDVDADADEEEEEEEEIEEEEEELQYTSGLRTEDSWISNFASLSYDLPEGFSMVSDEDITNYVQLGSDMLFAEAGGHDLSELLAAKVVYEFMSIDGVGNNLIAMTEKVKVGTSAETVLDGTKKTLEAMSSDSYQVSVSDTYLTVKIGDYEYLRMDVAVTVGAVTYDQTMFVRVIGDRAVCFSFTYISKAYFEDMLAGFSAY